ncbi:unnamed protein product [Closterium sp. NIES-53]
MSATHVTAGGIAPSYGYFNFTPDRISVTPLLVGRPDILTWKEAIEPQLEMVGLIGFARGTVAMPEEHYPDLRAEFRAVIDDLYIGQLEEQLSHIRMGEEETATNYCNRARRILATMRMVGVHYSTASYLTHFIEGLRSSYNLLKRLTLAPSTRATLNEDSLTSYILQDEAMQEAEQPSKLLAQVNYVASVKQGGRPGQRGQSGGGGSSGWNPTKDADKKKSAKDSSRGGGSRCRECWLCGEPNHLSFECPDRINFDDDDAKGGRGRCGSRCSRRDDEASCSLVGVVEPTVSLAPEAGEDFQAMAAAVQADPAVILLDSGCSHHLMGTKEVFVDLQPSGDVKHVRGFNGVLQDVQGRGTVVLQGEARRQVLIPDVLYVPGMLHTRLAHVGMNTIRSSAKHEVATGLDLKSASGADLTCVLCVVRKLARHTFPDQGSDADNVLAVVHVDLYGPFRVAAKDGSLYFLLLKDRKTRYVWRLEQSTLQPRTTPYQLLTGKNPDLPLARSEHGPASGRKPTILPTNTSTTTLPLLAEVGDPAAKDVEDVPSPFPSPAPRAPPLVADLRGLTLVSASSNEGRSGASPVAPAKSIAGRGSEANGGKVGKGGRDKAAADRGAGSSQTDQEAVRNQAVGRGADNRGEVGRDPGEVQQDDEGSEAGDDGGEAEESSDSDVVEV